MHDPKLIVCDTNIWYGIENGTISRDELINKRLALTGLAIREILSSENMYKNFDLIKRVVKTIRLNMDEVIFEGPFEYVYNTIPLTNRVDDTYWKNNYEELMALEKQDFFTNITFDQFKNQIDDFDAPFIETAKRMNQNLAKLKTHKKTIGKKQIRQIDLKVVAFKQIRDILQNRFFKGGKLPELLFPKQHLELYAIIWDEYSKVLTLQNQSRITTNDIYDLFHVLYVSKNSKYWTKEKKWNRLISNSDNGIPYLVECNANF